jgi:hypothetical protein
MSTVHSFLFALVPAAMFLATSMGVFPMSPSSVWRAFLFVTLSNVVLLGLLSLWRTPRAAAVTLSWFYILLSFYTAALPVLSRVVPGTEAGCALLYVTACAAIALIVGRPTTVPDVRHRNLTFVSAILFAVSSGMVLWYGLPFRSRSWEQPIAAILDRAPNPQRVPAQPPDIYYIVLDGFGRADILRERYELDISAEIEALRMRGWMVPTRSRANYSQTYLSLASTLNGEYLDPLPETMKQSRDRRPLFELIQRSRPITGLKRLGYSFHMIGSNTSVTATHRLADSCACRWPGLNEFENGLLSVTPFRMLPLYGPTYGGQYRAVIGGFDELERAPREDTRPRFVFAHIMAPHPPFVVNRDGSPRRVVGAVNYQDGDNFPGLRQEYVDGYQQQTRFVIKRLLRFADWLETSRQSAVVIAHGDHGQRLPDSDRGERLPIFMALRMGGQAGIPEDLSPVNVFRLVFNTHFGGEFRLLPNRSYYAEWDRPYQLMEIRFQ